MTQQYQTRRNRFKRSYPIALAIVVFTTWLAGCGGGGGDDGSGNGAGGASLGLVVRVDGNEVDATDGVVRLTGIGASASITCDKTCGFTSETSNGAGIASETSNNSDWFGALSLPDPTSDVHVTATPADGTSLRTIIFNRQLAGSVTS